MNMQFMASVLSALKSKKILPTTLLHNKRGVVEFGMRGSYDTKSKDKRVKTKE